jgi:hypothetical protein
MIEITQNYKTDLFAVQEVRWLGRSIIERDCRIPYSCEGEENISLVNLILVNISDQE